MEKIAATASALRGEGFDWMPGPPGVSAVYALTQRGVVVYVGQAGNIYQRIAKHLQSQRRPKRAYGGYSPGDLRVRPMEFDGVLVRLTPRVDLDRVERELILRLRPKYNQRMLAPPPPPVKVDLLALGLMERPKQRRRRVL